MDTTNLSIPPPVESINHTFHWPWARDGHASCLIAEHIYEEFTVLSLTFSGAGYPEPDKKSYEAVKHFSSMKLFGLVSRRLTEGYSLVHMDQTSAVIKRD